MRVPPNGLFTRENPTKMDDLGAPLFQETTRWTPKMLGLDDDFPSGDGVFLLKLKGGLVNRGWESGKGGESMPLLDDSFHNYGVVFECILFSPSGHLT